MRISKFLGTVLAVVIVLLGASTTARVLSPRGAMAAAQALPPTATAVPTPALPPTPTPQTEGTITVSGQGTAIGVPDVAYATLGVVTSAASVQDATDSNDKQVAAVIAAVKAANVAEQDIRTAGFSITPQYSQPDTGTDGAGTITGFRVSNTINVTINQVSDASSVLQAAIQAGVNSAVGIRFTIKDLTALQQQALTGAMQQSRAKADSLAKAAGVKLTGAYTVTEQTAAAPTPATQAVASTTDATAPPVEKGQLIVGETVTVAYLYTH